MLKLGSEEALPYARLFIDLFVEVSAMIDAPVHDFAYWAGLFSNLSTAAGFPVALIGGWIALQAYRSSARNASSALIHSLFSEYLKMRMDHSSSTSLIVADRKLEDTTAEQVAAMKLYVLEEMHGWVVREEALLRRLRFFLTEREINARTDTIESWKSTLRTHARQNRESVRKSFYDYATCYGVAFLEFIAEDWREREFSQFVCLHRVALHGGHTRPPGAREQNYQATGEVL